MSLFRSSLVVFLSLHSAWADDASNTELSDLMSPPDAATEVSPETSTEISSEPATAQTGASSISNYSAKVRERYSDVDPAWAFQPLVTLNGLGGSSSSIRQLKDVSSKGYGFQVEFFPHFLHKVGGVSLGAGLLVYQPSQVGGSILAKQIGLWSWTANARWQLHFIKHQPLVPFVGFEAEQLHYNFIGGPNNTIVSKGPSLGAMLLLNFIEPDAAADAFVTNGVVRTYLFLEMRTQSGSNGDMTLSGRSLFFGFRFEGAT